MNVNYNKFNFCRKDNKKFSKDIKICDICGKPLATKRRRIISDYLERKQQKEFLILAKTLLGKTREGLVIYDKIEEYLRNNED